MNPICGVIKFIILCAYFENGSKGKYVYGLLLVVYSTFYVSA